MVSLYKDPDGDKVFIAHNKTLEIHSVPSCLKLDTESEVDALKQKIRQLEDQLKEYVVSITEYQYYRDLSLLHYNQFRLHQNSMQRSQW